MNATIVGAVPPAELAKRPSVLARQQPTKQARTSKLDMVNALVQRIVKTASTSLGNRSRMVTLTASEGLLLTERLITLEVGLEQAKQALQGTTHPALKIIEDLDRRLDEEVAR